MKKLTYLFAITFLIFSCSEDSDTTTDDSEPDVTINDEDSLLVKKIIYSDSDGDIAVDNFTYDADNNLISILDSDGRGSEYIYESGLLKRINYSFGSYSILEHDVDNRLSSYTVYIPYNNEGIRYDYTYNSDGTINQKKYHGDFDTQTRFVSEATLTFNNSQKTLDSYMFIDDDMASLEMYSYDTKNGVYKNINNINTLNIIDTGGDFSSYITGAGNNLLKISETYDGSLEIYEEYEYTYNSSNYPVTAIYKEEGVIEATIEYFYE